MRITNLMIYTQWIFNVAQHLILECNTIEHSCRSRRLGVIGVEVKGGMLVEWRVEIGADLRNRGSQNAEQPVLGWLDNIIEADWV